MDSSRYKTKKNGLKGINHLSLSIHRICIAWSLMLLSFPFVCLLHLNGLKKIKVNKPLTQSAQNKY